jgi:hypothetical protein
METPAGLFALGALQMEIVKGKKGMWEKILESFACGAKSWIQALPQKLI